MELKYYRGNPAFPFEGKEGAVCSVWEMTLGHNEAVAPHAHPTGIEIYVVLDGIGEMRLGEEENAVFAGDVVYIPPNTPHSAGNTSEQPLRVVGVLWEPSAQNADVAAHAQGDTLPGHMDASAALAEITRLTEFSESIKKRLHDSPEIQPAENDAHIAELEHSIMQSISRICAHYTGRI